MRLYICRDDLGCAPFPWPRQPRSITPHHADHRHPGRPCAEKDSHRFCMRSNYPMFLLSPHRLYSQKLLSSNTPNTPNFLFNKFSPKRRLRVRLLLRTKSSSVDLILTAIDLLERLLQFDPSKRITATEALSHPYFTSTASPSYGPSPTPGSMPPPQFNFPHPHPHAHHQPQSQVQQQQQAQPPQQIIVQQPGQQLVPQQPGYPPHPPSMFVTQDAARMQAQAQAQAMAQAQAQVAHAHAQAQAAHAGQQGYGPGGYPGQYQHPR